MSLEVGANIGQMNEQSMSAGQESASVELQQGTPAEIQSPFLGEAGPVPEPVETPQQRADRIDSILAELKKQPLRSERGIINALKADINGLTNAEIGAKAYENGTPKTRASRVSAALPGIASRLFGSQLRLENCYRGRTQYRHLLIEGESVPIDESFPRSVGRQTGKAASGISTKGESSSTDTKKGVKPLTDEEFENMLETASQRMTHMLISQLLNSVIVKDGLLEMPRDIPSLLGAFSLAESDAGRIKDKLGDTSLEEVLVARFVEAVEQYHSRINNRVRGTGRESFLQGRLMMLLDSGVEVGSIVYEVSSHFGLPLPERYKGATKDPNIALVRNLIGTSNPRK